MSTNKIYVKNAAGDGEEAPVSNVTAGLVNAWSPDGRFLLYTGIGTNYDIWAMPLLDRRAAGKPVAVANSGFNEQHPQVSPDSRWVAYTSNESGVNEVYVRPFPPDPARVGTWLVSANSGQQPRWRRDGKELYYLAVDGSVMAIDIRTSPHFESGVPNTLFRAPGMQSGLAGFRYAAHEDGKRFLLITQSQTAVSEPTTIVVNWVQALDRQ
jgi:Tol biopolymer transport system component